MTFTYDVVSPTDVTRVRFHTGDTVEATARFTDEEISFVVSEMGSWQKATIACIQKMISEISATPDFQADWLRVDSSNALAALKELLAQKRRELSVSAYAARGQAVYRGDSDLTDVPDSW